MLRRYDLASDTAEFLKVEITDMNRGAKWITRKQGIVQLVDAVMQTRPNLDRRLVLRMVIGMWRAKN